MNGDHGLRGLDNEHITRLAHTRHDRHVNNSDRRAKKFSHTADYVTHARQAIKEMYLQVGDLVVDESGVAQKGLIVRHLILPNGLANSEGSLSWLVQELSPTVTISIMSQYMPMHRASQIPPLSRKITINEHETVLKLINDLGIENGWVQEMGAAEEYLPDFERKGHPFSPANSQNNIPIKPATN